MLGKITTKGTVGELSRLSQTSWPFNSSVKHFYIMGGSMEGVGNVTTTAEFNFYVDPEAGNPFRTLT